MIRTRPLTGCTYSRLGATLGSPKLRLLSLLSTLSSFPFVLSVQSRELLLSSFLFPARCCVPRPLPNYSKTLALTLTVSPLRLLGPQGVAPLPTNNPVIPARLRLNNARNSRCLLTRDFYLGGDNLSLL